MLGDRSSTHHREELVLYGLLVVIGALPVGTTLARRAAFEVEATLGLLMVCAGVIGAVFYALRACGRSDRHDHAAGASGAGSRRR
jgi:hypothetical protein